MSQILRLIAAYANSLGYHVFMQRKPVRLLVSGTTCMQRGQTSHLHGHVVHVQTITQSLKVNARYGLHSSLYVAIKSVVRGKVWHGW